MVGTILANRCAHNIRDHKFGTNKQSAEMMKWDRKQIKDEECIERGWTLNENTPVAFLFLSPDVSLNVCV